MMCDGYILAKVTCFDRRLDNIEKGLRMVWTKEADQTWGNSFVYTQRPELMRFGRLIFRPL